MAPKKRGRRAPAKKSRARQVAVPKFVQLAVAMGGLYALDEAGGVWKHDPDARGTWAQLDSTRKPTSDDEEM